MPRPAELDVRLAPLIAAWREADDEIQARIEAAAARYARESDRETKAAQRRAMARLRRAGDLVDSELAALETITRSWLVNEFPLMYEASSAAAALAVGGEFVMNENAIRSLNILANDIWDTTLEATTFVSADTKRTIARIGRSESLLTETLGDTSRQASRRAADRARRAGIGSVRYRNGARHRIGEYMDMALDTKVALANTAAATNVYKAVGVELIELSDGPDCGLFSHGGTPLANGQIIPLELFQAFPLAHPRCRRDGIPRLDLNGRTPAEMTPIRTPERRANLESFQRSLSIQNRNASLRERRAIRAAG